MRDVVLEVDGALGRITLNRPSAINALTLPMVRAIDAALTAWEEDPAVGAVLLDGAGERGLCAGGDIVALHDSARADGSAARRFWREEYALNARIARYPKPFVALMDGIVMGGGVGLSGHASHRVATERLVWAMPEVLIGFAPDVGGTHLLSRAPGELGTHLALTAGRVGLADALACGFADVFVASGQLDRLRDDLRGGDVDAALAAAARESGPPPDAPLPTHRRWIDACYGAEEVEQIVAALRGREEPAAAAALDAIAAASPTSLKVTLRALRRARALPSLEACLAQEYDVSCALLETPDFVEGIRAAVVDKDRRPRWSPATLAEVPGPAVEAVFSPRAGRPLAPASRAPRECAAGGRRR